MPDRQFECVIVGGGVCGALLAGLAAQRGLHVLLCDSGENRTWPEETLLPSAKRAFAAAGLEALLAAVGRPDSARQGAIWGSASLAWRASEPEPGWRVPRPALERALRRWAAAQGATVWEQHTALGPLGGGSLRLRRADGSEVEVAAPVCAVACGRSFPEQLVARRTLAEAPATAALHLRGGLDPRFADGNLIEAVAAGWFWYLPLADGTASLTLLADVDELQAVGTKTLLAQALAQALGPARTVREPSVRDAVRATARAQRADAVFLVGDAAAALDPLASQGIDKALAAAQAALPALFTAVREPELRALAIRHHAQWEYGVWRAHAAVAEDFYRREQRFADAPFWRRRHRDAAVGPGTMPARLRSDPRLVPTTALVRQGDHLVATPAIGYHDGDVFSHLGRVPAPSLLAAFARPIPAELAASLAARDPAIYVLPPRMVHDAIEQAWRLGLLIPDDRA